MAIQKVLTPEFRVSFPSVFTPRSAFDGQPPKYTITMLFPKGTDLKALQEAARAAAREKWGDKLPANLRSPFRDGDKEKSHLEGYKGCIFINATSKMKPGIVGPDRQAIISADDFYAGCFARATINAFAYDQKGNKGVAFGIQNIQKLRDGEPFSGRTKAEDDFDAYESPDNGGAAATAEAGAKDDFDI